MESKSSDTPNSSQQANGADSTPKPTTDTTQAPSESNPKVTEDNISKKLGDLLKKDKAESA